MDNSQRQKTASIVNAAILKSYHEERGNFIFTLFDKLNLFKSLGYHSCKIACCITNDAAITRKIGR